MQTSLGGFAAVLLAGWVVLSAAGMAYARQKGLPAWIAAPLLAAFLLEYAFYLLPGFEAVRLRLKEGLAGWRLALLLSVSALLPYLTYSLGTAQFRWPAFLGLAALVAAISFWYILLPLTGWTDGALLCLIAALVLRKSFQFIYISPVPSLDVQVLGHLMLIRLTATVMLVLRGVDGIRFGFLPDKGEWRIGVRYFLYFAPIGFPLALWMGLIRFDPASAPWQAIAVFAGMLWVVALSEEFFFRGLLQQWLADWTNRPKVALAVASILFGLCHLPFRSFPNWKFASIAALAGCFYGHAYNRARGIRAPMVTHALVVTTWRVMFS